MSESIRHPKNPPGLGVGSVPVLFTLKNVQPSIVGGMKKSKTNERQPNESESAKSVASLPTAMPETSPTPLKSTTKSNRVYNVAVGLLIFAVCLLLLRNSQGTKPDTKETIASNRAQPNSSELRSVADSETDLIPPSLPKTSLANFSNSANSSSTADLPELAQPLSEPDRFPDSIASQDSDALIGNALSSTPNEEQPLVQAKPPMLLLPSTKPVNTGETDTVSENQVSGNQNNSALTYSPQPSAATSPSGDTNHFLAGDNAIYSRPSIVDTASPSMTTRELIDLHERGKQNKPSNSWNSTSFPSGTTAQGVPASPISSVAPVFDNNPTYAANAIQPNNVNDSRMMSGRPYPPLPREYPPLTIPAYEQNALSGRQGFSNTTPTSPMIRQPANGSNRYQSISPQTSTTPIPYTPIAPPQSGNSIGYPPGN